MKIHGNTSIACTVRVQYSKLVTEAGRHSNTVCPYYVSVTSRLHIIKHWTHRSVSWPVASIKRKFGMTYTIQDCFSIHEVVFCMKVLTSAALGLEFVPKLLYLCQ